MPHRRLLWLAGLLAATAVVLGAARGIDAWRARSALAEARLAMARGRFDEAEARLAPLAAGRGEAALLLGDCRIAQDRPGEAIEAWALVPEGSPSAVAAALRRARVAADLGRFAEAESALELAVSAGGPRAAEAREALLKLLWREARFDEVAARVEDQWDDLERSGRLDRATAVDLLRGRLALDLETFPVDRIEADLRQLSDAGRGDGRLEVARARWAVVAGRLDDAKARLDDAWNRGPVDAVAWHTLLDWARAADRVDEAARAMVHLPATDPGGRLTLGLRAWLASRRGDDAAERAALQRLSALDPGDARTLERLAALSTAAGDPTLAAELRHRKAALDEARLRYAQLFADDALAPRAAEMGRLAEALGRPFEARAFASLAAGRFSGSAARRPTAAGHASASSTGGRTVADLLAADLAPFASTPRHASSAIVPHFTDEAGPAGLAFTFDNGASPAHQFPETMSGGVGVLDYDGDGRLDVFAVQGGPFPPPSSGRAAFGDRLFRNVGSGRFEDATAASALAALAGGYGHGVAVGDYDNDGHPDLFVTRWRAYALYRNRGDGTFEDATARAGLGGDRDWPTSAAFADLDGDGDLDLYVCHYLRWDAEHPQSCPSRRGDGLRYCDPRHFEALPDHLFRNDGGRFVDATASAGLADRDGRGLGVVAADVDDDGRIDLFVANDGTANFLLRNLGGMRFEEVAQASGVAGNASGGYQAGMGIAAGDLDGDGRLDLLVTNFYGESTTFFRSLGGGVFADSTDVVGLSGPSRGLLGFGIALFDANDDGRLDVATTNGHVNDDRPEFPWMMPCQLLVGGPDGRLADVSREAGPPWSVFRLGRGLASGDLDGDGRVDLVVLPQGSPLAFFRNGTRGGHCVTLRLQGTTSNRDAVGAVITARVGERTLRAWRAGGGSYQSASDGRIHFGLGDSNRADSVEVRWPSGRVDKHSGLDAGRTYLLREGDPKAVP